MLGLRVLLWQSDGLEEKALLPQYLVHGNDGPTSQTDFFVDSLLGEALDLEQDGEVVIDMDAVADAAGKEGEKPSFYVSEQSQQRKFTCGTCEEFNDILGGCPRKPQMSSR